MVGDGIIKRNYDFNNNGFTLTELLAVIVILSIIGSITAYVTLSSINNAKEESYQVTINEIESGANSYAIETSIFKDSNFICVTIQELIDYGYLKNDVVNSNVSDNRKVLLTDKVYVEKNNNNGVINEIDYLSKKCE